MKKTSELISQAEQTTASNPSYIKETIDLYGETGKHILAGINTTRKQLMKHVANLSVSPLLATFELGMNAASLPSLALGGRSSAIAARSRKTRSDIFNKINGGGEYALAA